MSHITAVPNKIVTADIFVKRQYGHLAKYKGIETIDQRSKCSRAVCGENMSAISKQLVCMDNFSEFRGKVGSLNSTHINFQQ